MIDLTQPIIQMIKKVINDKIEIVKNTKIECGDEYAGGILDGKEYAYKTVLEIIEAIESIEKFYEEEIS